MNSIKRILTNNTNSKIKSIFINNSNNNNIYRQQQCFYSNNNKQQEKDKEDLLMVREFLNQIKEEKEFLNKFIEKSSSTSNAKKGIASGSGGGNAGSDSDNHEEFIYEKGDLRKVSESYAKSMALDFEEGMKREDDVYNRLLTDLKNRKIAREAKLRKDKLKTNTIHYILTALIGVCVLKYYMMGIDKTEKNKESFDANWESLRVIVNKKDELKEKKAIIINSISNELVKYSNNNQEIDIDDIKDNVDSILNQYCIENKSPSEIKIQNNDISNSKI